MLPVVAKVIGVEKFISAGRKDVRESGRSAVLDVGAVGARHAVSAVANAKFPKVAIEPTQGPLNDRVQGFEVHRGAHSNSSPDQWFDVLDLDAQGGDSVFGGGQHSGNVPRL